eukprot:13159215-Ditylum_brightwellii.AAC.1
MNDKSFETTDEEDIYHNKNNNRKRNLRTRDLQVNLDFDDFPEDFPSTVIFRLYSKTDYGTVSWEGLLPPAVKVDGKSALTAPAAMDPQTAHDILGNGITIMDLPASAAETAEGSDEMGTAFKNLIEYPIIGSAATSAGLFANLNSRYLLYFAEEFADADCPNAGA